MKKMSDKKCLSGKVWCVKYGEMNGCVSHVHKCRVTDLIIEMRMFLYSKGRRQSQAKGEEYSAGGNSCAKSLGESITFVSTRDSSY